MWVKDLTRSLFSCEWGCSYRKGGRMKCAMHIQSSLLDLNQSLGHWTKVPGGLVGQALRQRKQARDNSSRCRGCLDTGLDIPVAVCWKCVKKVVSLFLSCVWWNEEVRNWSSSCDDLFKKAFVDVTVGWCHSILASFTAWHGTGGRLAWLLTDTSPLACLCRTRTPTPNWVCQQGLSLTFFSHCRPMWLVVFLSH